MERIEEAAGRIRRLEVQGATNVAVAAIRALVDFVRSMEAPDRGSILRGIDVAREVLFETRETEPFMRNAIRYVEWRARQSDIGSGEELQDLVESVSEELLRSLSTARRRIVEVGSRRLLPGYRVLTHCHSSAVSGVLREAKVRGVDFEVFITETRPKYQGRITAGEMLEAGVKTTMVVDSAVRSFINKMDIVLVGADAITSEGNVINKIGTSLVALAAHEARVPLYVVTELLKFDPETTHGDYEVIEERDASEVWPDAPEGLTIRNPAFDVTRRDYIHGIICEEGVISPHSILEAVHRRYPWIMEFASPAA